MTEQDYRNLVTNLASRYLGCKTDDPTQRFLVDVYNLILPHPRGYKMEYGKKWCAVFVSVVGTMTQLCDIIPFECGCGEMVNLAKAAGSWKGKVTPQPADIIVYDQNKDGWADHVGFVEAVNGSGITTIEGNASGGQCVRKTVLLSDGNILGFICPDYASLATAPTVVEKPQYAETYDKNASGRYYITTTLCLRKGPGTLYGILAYMPQNGSVEADGYQKGNWYHVQYGNKEGWCSCKYLRR